MVDGGVSVFWPQYLGLPPQAKCGRPSRGLNPLPSASSASGACPEQLTPTLRVGCIVNRNLAESYSSTFLTARAQAVKTGFALVFELFQYPIPSMVPGVSGYVIGDGACSDPV